MAGTGRRAMNLHWLKKTSFCKKLLIHLTRAMNLHWLKKTSFCKKLLIHLT